MCVPSPDISCICAVAVRERGVALGIDMCGSLETGAMDEGQAGPGGGTPHVRVIQYSKHKRLPKGTSVTRDQTGKQFTVSFPAGTLRYIDVVFMLRGLC